MSKVFELVSDFVPMGDQPQAIEALEANVKAGVRDQVKVLIGGAPITDAYAEKIGADGYAPDASRAVKLAKALV